MLSVLKRIVIFFISGVIIAISFNITMDLIVHRKRKVVVPDLTGKPLKQAIKVLQEKGLYIKIVGSKHNEKVPPDSVISQEPLPGEIVRRERAISIILSEGGELVYVPDLKNLSMGEAEILLKRSSLILGEVSKVFSSEFKKGRIISQEPEAGEVVKKGEIVNIIVSKGPSTILGTVIMPKLVGKNITEAKNILFDMGIEISDIKKVVNNKVPEGTILKQNPQPGEVIDESTDISLIISEKREIEELFHKEVFYFEIPQGPNERRLKVVKEDLNGKEVIISSLEKPGTKILREINMMGKTKLYIYLDDTLVEVKKYE